MRIGHGVDENMKVTDITHRFAADSCGLTRVARSSEPAQSPKGADAITRDGWPLGTRQALMETILQRSNHRYGLPILTMHISLLHATYQAGPAAVCLRDKWIAAADQPSRVEHLFSSNADDEISMSCEEIAAGVVGCEMPGRVTAVRNWNAAAAASTGDLLVVIADDLHPSHGWDTALEALCHDLDPVQAAFVINVHDHEARSHLIRHPVISRKYYQNYGLWHPQYDGFFVDDDFTLSAHRRNVVIDGSHLKFDHKHGQNRGRSSSSASQKLMMTTWTKGKTIFVQRWPTWKRRLIRRPLKPRAGQVAIGPGERAIRGTVARLGYLLALLPDTVRTRLRSITRR